MKYGYVALEGPDRSRKDHGGTPTGRSLSRTARPGGVRGQPFLPRFYADPGRYAFSVELSFLAQRYHQLKRTTEQDLFSQCTVADYSLGKSLVFAKVTLPEDEYALFLDLYTIMYGDLPAPELVVYLHLNMDLVRERIRMRGGLRAGHRRELPGATSGALPGPPAETDAEPGAGRGHR